MQWSTCWRKLNISANTGAVLKSYIFLGADYLNRRSQKRREYKILTGKILANDQIEERVISENNTQMKRMEAGC
jgi:hypothetical protein